MRAALAKHWPEYLIEGWALGTFMVSAALCTMLFEHPSSPVRAAIGNADLRRVLIGVCRIARVDDMEQQVRIRGLVERRAE